MNKKSKTSWIVFQIQVSIKDTNIGYEYAQDWQNKRVFRTTSSCQSWLRKSRTLLFFFGLLVWSSQSERLTIMIQGCYYSTHKDWTCVIFD